MYSPPAEPGDQQRMRAAFARFTGALDAVPDGPEVWGWHGRTLSGRVQHPSHGTCWLRMLSGPQDKAAGKVWDGNCEAAQLFDKHINKPALHEILKDNRDGHAYQAELSQYVSESVCSSDPVLRTDLEVTTSWWDSLRGDLEQVAATETDRVAVRQEWIDRSVPSFLGLPAPTVTQWATAHGDLHTANLTTTTPYLLDWEGFGTAPLGYDAAMLLAYSLLVPGFAERLRKTFPVLSTEPGRVAQLVVATELMQSASRGDHPELVPVLHTLVAGLV